MIKSNKKTLIIILCILVVFFVAFIVLEVAHHGTYSLQRDNDVTYSIRSYSSYEDRRLEISYDSSFYNEGKNNNGDELQTNALCLKSNEDYLTFSSQSHIGFTGDTSSTFFSQYDLVVVQREGSFYKLSEVREFKINAYVAQTTYRIENSQMVGGEDNKAGIYSIDFFKVYKDEVKSIKITDRTF